MEKGERRKLPLYFPLFLPALGRICFRQGWGINRKRYLISLYISQAKLGRFGPDLYSQPHSTEDRRPALRKAPAHR